MKRLLADIADRNRSLVAQWAALNARQRWTVAAIIGGLVLVLGSMSLEQRASQIDMFRRQFHIPGNIAFAEFRPGNTKNRRRPEIQGVVRFTEEGFGAYLATLNDTAVWTPIPLDYGGRTITGDYAADALDWRERGPLPRRAGDPVAEWGNLSRERFYAIENARHFCFAVLQQGLLSNGTEPRHRVLPCWDLAAEDDYVVKIQGALDLDTRTLHMQAR